jgi:peptidoglycan/LPS O-acetylase OafA/YrhL
MALFLFDGEWKQRFLRVAKPWAWIVFVVGYICVQFYYRHHYYTLLESALLAVIVAVTVVQPQTFMGRFLELGGMRWIGRLSYSLYLWQQFFLLPGAKFPLSLSQRFPFNCLFLLVATALSYQFVERPMIRVGHRLAPPPTPGRSDLEVADLIQFGSNVPNACEQAIRES